MPIGTPPSTGSSPPGPMVTMHPGAEHEMSYNAKLTDVPTATGCSRIRTRIPSALPSTILRRQHPSATHVSLGAGSQNLARFCRWRSSFRESLPIVNHKHRAFSNDGCMNTMMDRATRAPGSEDGGRAVQQTPSSADAGRCSTLR